MMAWIEEYPHPVTGKTVKVAHCRTDSPTVQQANRKAAEDAVALMEEQTPAQRAIEHMREAIRVVQRGHILKTELVSEGTRTYSQVINGWRIEELEAEVKRLKEENDDLRVSLQEANDSLDVLV